MPQQKISKSNIDVIVQRPLTLLSQGHQTSIFSHFIFQTSKGWKREWHGIHPVTAVTAVQWLW